MGVVIVSSEEEEAEEQTEDDKEVERLMNKGLETKWKVVTVMSNLSDRFNTLMCVLCVQYVKHVKLNVFFNCSC